MRLSSLINFGASIVDRCLAFLAGGFNAPRRPTPIPVPLSSVQRDIHRSRR